MKADALWFLSDFIATNKVVFKIPVYQRNYDWSEGNCNRLLDDIKDIIDEGNKHFIGSIVYMAVDDGGFSLKEYIIIDGQQRLTTMMIILKALSDLSKDIDEDCHDEIETSYLHNHHCDEEYKVKLKPIKSDSEQFINLLKGTNINEESHIALNYEICKKRIKKWIDDGVRPNKILRSLEKLQIVAIGLIQGQDDPQIIFESINSTGLELTNADLIRNFLLMNAKDQARLYDDYWTYIEQVLKKDNDYTNLNMFFVQFVVYKTKKTVTEARLYEKFVEVYKKGAYTQESILQELKYFADIFKCFVYDKNKYSTETRKILNDLRLLNQTTCYPFMLHVFNDYEHGRINDKVLEKTMHVLLSYLVRRIVCGIPSNSLRGLFISLYSRVFKVIENKNKYYESINKFLSVLETKDAMPDDGDFFSALQSVNLYNNSALCKYLLSNIENNGKENIVIDDLTIEHIMPQTLNLNWQHIDPLEHKQFLHVLGNLSITGYNSELSNKSFDEKRKLIKTYSKAVILNSDVLDKNIWGINEIKERGKRLAKIVLDQYNVDTINDNSIEFEYLNKITLDNLSDVTGKKIVNFYFDGKVYRQDTYAYMMVDIIKILAGKYPEIIKKMAKENFVIPGGKTVFISDNEAAIKRQVLKVQDDLYIESNVSAKMIMKIVKELLLRCGENTTDFYVSVVVDKNSEEIV